MYLSIQDAIQHIIKRSFTAILFILKLTFGLSVTR